MVRLRRRAAQPLARLRNIAARLNACLVLVSFSGPVRGESPYSELEDIELRVESAGVPGCPDQLALEQWINVLVGRQFAREGAAVIVRLTVSPSEERTAGPLRAVLTATQRADAAAPYHLLREFRQAVPCDEVAMAAALTVSLMASAVHSPPSSAPPAENNAPRLLPLQSPVVEERSTRRPGDRLGERAGADSSPGPNVPLDGEEPISLPFTPQLGASADAGVGANPGVGLGASVFLGAGIGDWSLRVLGSYAAGTGEDAAGGGQVLGTSWSAELLVCQSASRLTWCILGGPWWLVAWGREFDIDRRTVLGTVRFGALASYLWPLSDTVSMGPAASVVVPLRPAELEVLGDEEVAWRGPPMAGRLSVLVQWE